MPKLTPEQLEQRLYDLATDRHNPRSFNDKRRLRISRMTPIREACIKFGVKPFLFRIGDMCITRIFADVESIEMRARHVKLRTLSFFPGEDSARFRRDMVLDVEIMVREFDSAVPDLPSQIKLLLALRPGVPVLCWARVVAHDLRRICPAYVDITGIVEDP